MTDRPDITEASTVVPYGSLQVENGPVWTTRQQLRTLDGLETRLRFGIARLTELRLGVPDYFYNRGRPEHASGFGDLVVGAKQQLGPLPGDLDLSVIGAVSLPTGTSGVSSGGVDPEIKFPWSRELTGPWSIGGMWSAFWTTADGRRNFTWEPTLYIERQLTKGVDAFVEYAGDYFQHGPPQQIFHVGAAYRPRPTQQIDLHVGVGLSRAAPNLFVGIGYSFRFDHLLR